MDKGGRSTDFTNVYEDPKRAAAYSKLELPGTYYLAFRDLPRIMTTHVNGTSALDFGCGTGRSTRFLQRLGFTTVGIDISREMLEKARELDPKGDYRLTANDDYSQLPLEAFDLILSAFTFDNIPTLRRKVEILAGLKDLMNQGCRLVNLVSSPEIYVHEWASFSTKDFPENKHAKSGDKMRIIQTDTADKRPVTDILWTPEHYLETYSQAGLAVVEAYKPLAMETEPYKWVNETRIAPWTTYVLRRGKTVVIGATDRKSG